MAIYPIINKETGETKELSMTMIEYEKWKEKNPEWDKDWSQGCAGIGEVGEWKDKLIKSKPGWNDVLLNASKAPKSNVKPI